MKYQKRLKLKKKLKKDNVLDPSLPSKNNDDDDDIIKITRGQRIIGREYLIKKKR